MGISNLHVLYDEFEVVPMTTKSTTPEPPDEPDVFDEDKFLGAEEDQADFDVEETNKKETE